MNKNGLVLRLAIVVIFTAIAAGFITTQIFYRIVYLTELESTGHKISQLSKTVSPTASIASYLEDTELTKEVINGLMTNDIVASAKIKTMTLEINSDDYIENANTIKFSLYSPFEKAREVGALIITPDLKHIEMKADKISRNNALALMAEASIVTLMTIVIAYLVITRPILAIAQSLHTIILGTKERIKAPENHNHSELGQLVIDINKLLDKAEQQIFNERKLRSEVELLEKRFRMLFENSTAPIVLTEPQGNILLYNEAFANLIEKTNGALKKNYGPYLRELFVDKKQLDKVVQFAFGNDETATGEFKLSTQIKDEILWVQAVVTSTTTKDFKEYYQVTLHDISKRKKLLEQLNHKANYDQLTQLLNRQAAENQIQYFIHNQTPFALLLMDLNSFKPINDIYGHDAGDEVLIHVASQLTNTLRKEDILSRWGGDEFVILLPQINPKHIKNVTAKLNVQIQKSLYLKDHDESVSVSACMGVCFFPDHQSTMKQLVKSADLAMYSVKQQRIKNPEYYLSIFAPNSQKKD